MTGAGNVKAAAPFKADCVLEAKPVSCCRSAKLVLTEKGMARDETVKKLDWAESFADMEGEDFSGEITYEFTFKLTAEQAKASAVLTLEWLEHSAAVWINGQPAGYMALKPLRLAIPAGLMKPGENRLAIEVANTASNVYDHVNPLDWFDEAHVGPYNEREQVMERERMDGGLYGKVTIEIAQ